MAEQDKQQVAAQASEPTPMQTYKRLLGYVLPHWKVFIIAAIAMGVVAATTASFAYLIQPMMDGTFVERDPQVIQYTPIVMILLFLVNGIATYFSTYFMTWVARNVIKTLRSEMFQQVLSLPVRFFDTTPSGTIISRLIYDVEQVASASADIITIMVRDSLTVVGLLGIMLFLDWQLALILFVGTPLIAQIINYINKRFRRYSSRIQTSMGKVTHIAEEAIEGQRVVKTFGGEQYESERFEKINERNRRLQMKMAATSAASVPVVQLVAVSAAAGVVYVALQGVATGATSIGAFMSFVASMMMLLAPVKRLTKITANLQKGITAATHIFAFLDEEVEREEGQRTLTRARGEVRFRQVNFSYNAGKEQILHDINLHLSAGKTMALVGHSGSGKTTLANLLPRFYEAEQGEITIDGIPIHELTLQSLRSQISLVSQHITLFNDTIANNIAYGSLGEAGREDIIRAAEAAHAMEFINKQPEGLDTMVGENGVLLSGGQRQRLAIARALLKDAPILILDEATSALDTASERHIQTALEKLMENRSTLVIAHRLSTIEKADSIVVMDQGRVVEQGSHQELLEHGGQYAALYNMQFQDTQAG